MNDFLGFVPFLASEWSQDITRPHRRCALRVGDKIHRMRGDWGCGQRSPGREDEDALSLLRQTEVHGVCSYDSRMKLGTPGLGQKPLEQRTVARSEQTRNVLEHETNSPALSHKTKEVCNEGASLVGSMRMRAGPLGKLASCARPPIRRIVTILNPKRCF
jgi:hypothetical protein